MAADPIGIALLGYGTVGSAVDRLLTARKDDVARVLGAPVEVRRALVRDVSRPRDPAPRAGLLTDDFAAIRPFREGDSPRRLAWKAMARTGGDTLLVRQFEGGSGGRVQLDWDALPGSLDNEARLSRLARWVVDAEAAGLTYALRVHGASLPLDSGPAHCAACLELLALAPD